jgi:hypothetical protein
MCSLSCNVTYHIDSTGCGLWREVSKSIAYCNWEDTKIRLHAFLPRIPSFVVFATRQANLWLIPLFFTINSDSYSQQVSCVNINITEVFFRNTVQTQTLTNTRTLIPMNTRTQPYLYEHLRETEPANPRDWWSYHKRSAKHKRRLILKNSLPQRVEPRTSGATEALVTTRLHALSH